MSVMLLSLLFLQDGETPLYVASQKGHIELVQILLQKNVDVNISKKVKCN